MELLEQFKQYLFSQKKPASKATVKNYIADVNKFIKWCETFLEILFDPKIVTPQIIELYKRKLQREIPHLYAPVKQANSSFQSSVPPPLVKGEEKRLSSKSAERYLSSLRKFFYFLKNQNIISTNPFEQLNELNPKRAAIDIDPYHLKDFKNYLRNNNSSYLTIKNYINDIRNFLKWHEILKQVQDDKRDIDIIYVEEYKQRLLKSGYSPLSVNRKLSSLRRYFAFLASSNYLSQQKTRLLASPLTSIRTDVVVPDPSFLNITNNKPLVNRDVDPRGVEPLLPDLRDQIPHRRGPTSFSTLSEEIIPSQYSSIPPVRLIQKTFKGFDFLFDYTFIKPLANTLLTINYTWCRIRGKKVFQSRISSSESYHFGQDAKSTLRWIPKQVRDDKTRSINNIKKEIYAPLTISTAGFPLHKKIMHHLKHNRPKWYKTYHNYSFAHYFHITILVFAATFLGIITYQSVYPITPIKKSVLSANIQNSEKARILAFQGKLSNQLGNPITSEKEVRFSLYDDPFASASSLLWEDVQQIKPDSNGVFSTKLLPEKLLTQNASLWLGITIENEPEIVPRQEIPTLSYANNAKYLEGLSPITNSNAGVKNVILALDSNGNLNIGENATPTFSATSGQFTLSGQVLFLTTNKGSDADIVLSPDGLGKVDLQKPLYNSSENGIVEIFDNLFVQASDSAKALFTINNINGNTDFLVNAIGNVGIGTATPSAKLDVLGDIKTTDLIVDGKTTLNGITYTFPKTAAVKNSLLTNNGAGTLSWTALESITNSSDDYKLDVKDTKNNNPVAFITNSSDSSDAQVLALKVNKNEPLTTNKFISFLNSSGTTIGSITGNGSGGVSYNSSGSDFAEYFRISQNNTEGIPHLNPPPLEKGEEIRKEFSFLPLEEGEEQGGGPSSAFDPGTLVCLAEDGGVLPCDLKHNNIVGIISEKAGFVGGSNYANNPEYVLVGLSGQLPLKVSLENGEIKPGDPITYSKTPGFGAKAVESGMIVGKAIQALKSAEQIPHLNPPPLEKGEETGGGTIPVFLSVSYYNPQIYVAKNGDFKFNIIENINSSSNQTETLTNVQDLILETQNYKPTLKEKTIAEKFSLIKNLIAKNLLAVQIIADKITTKSLVSPLASIDTIRTNVISPLSSDSITIRLQSVQSSKFKIQNSEGKAVATIDSSGNATFSGELSAASASISGDLLAHNLQTKEASIEGTLYADRIIANNIDGLEEKIASLSTLHRPNQNNILNYTESTSSALFSTDSQFSTSSNSNYSSSEVNVSERSREAATFDLNNLTIQQFNNTNSFNNLNVDFATFNQGIIALGPSSFTDIAISNQLSIGSQIGSMLVLADNAINVLGSTLELQPLKQGGISFVGGEVKIDESGNLKVNGNAEFASNVSVRGTLSANIISPLPESDFIVRLIPHLNPPPLEKGEEKGGGQRSSAFIVQDASGSSVLTIDQIGNVNASGSGKFTDILTRNLNIVRSAQADTSMTETIATSSAGTATIIQGETERTIITPYVLENSLIYISPTSNTEGVVPYVARQTIEDPINNSKGSFTIQIPQRLYKDININWWIVN